MATQLFIVNTGTTVLQFAYAPGTTRTNLRGSAVQCMVEQLSTVRGTGVDNFSTATVAGPTPGIEVQFNGGIVEWVSAPLAAAATISGSITWNLRASESAAQANTAINAQLEVIDGTTGALTLIDRTARVIELGTTESAQNFAETPAAGIACKKGDRLRVTVFGDDATGVNMGTGRTFNFFSSGTAAGATGDSYLTLTENVTFITTSPTGTQIFPTDTASVVSTASVDKEAWTSRGAGVQTNVRNTAAGFTAPLQMTDTAGGTVVDWFTKPLTAFTLGGAVRLHVRASAPAATGAVVGVEIARVAGDGTSPTVWATALADVVLTGAEASFDWFAAGNDLAITDGQRLRIRFFIDDFFSSAGPMVASQTVTLYYAGAAAATGDTYLTFTQTLTEYVPPPVTLIGASNAVSTATSTLRVYPTLTGYGGAIVADRPLVYYRLGEPSGTTAVATVGTDGAYANSPTLGVAGAVSGDTATTFSGTAEMTGTNGLTSSSNFSVEMWLKPTTLPATGVAAAFGSFAGGLAVCIGSGTDGSIAGSTLTLSDMSVRWINGVYVFPNTTAWHHIVITRDTTTLRVYVDGTQVTTDAAGLGSVANGLIAGKVFAGGSPFYFAGGVDEVATYDYVLTPTQVTTHFAAGGAPGAVALAGTSNAVSTATSALSASIPVVGATAATSTATSSLSATRLLAATATGSATAVSALTALRNLAGTAAATSIVTSTALINRGLVGAAAAVSTATSIASPTRGISGTVAAVSTVTAVAAAARPLTGATDAVSIATSTALINRGLIGATAAVSTALATPTLAIGLSGVSGASSLLTSALTTVAGGFPVSLTGTSAATSTAVSALSRTVPIAAVATGSSTATARLVYTAGLSAALSSVSLATGVLHYTAGLTATALGTSTPTSALRLTRGLAATSAAVSTATSKLSGTVPLLGSLAATSTASAVLGKSVPLTATAAGSATAIAIAHASRPLIALVTAQSSVIGVLHATIHLQATALGTSTATAFTIVARPLQATSSAVSTAVANLHVAALAEVNLIGLVAGISTASASVSRQVPLTGLSTAQSLATSVTLVTRGLTSTVAGISTATSALSALRPLASASAGTSTVSSVVSPVRGLVAASAATSTATGIVGTTRLGVTFTGAATATSSVTSTLVAQVHLVALSTGAGTAVSVLSRGIPLASLVAGQSSAAAAVAVLRPLQATASGTSTVVGSITPKVTFGAQVAATSSATASLSAARHLQGTVGALATATSSVAIGRRLLGTAHGLSTATAVLFREGVAALQGSIVATSTVAARFPHEVALVITDFQDTVAGPMVVTERVGPTMASFQQQAAVGSTVRVEASMVFTEEKADTVVVEEPRLTDFQIIAGASVVIERLAPTVVAVRQQAYIGSVTRVAVGAVAEGEEGIDVALVAT